MRDQLKVFLGELQFHSLTVGLEWWWYQLTLLLTILLLCKLCIGLRIRYLTWIRTINRMVREMVSFELVKEVEKDVFLSCHECGKKKKTWVPMRNWTSDLQILCSILYHWATETLCWARSITKFIWHASSILLGLAMSIVSSL